MTHSFRPSNQGFSVPLTDGNAAYIPAEDEVDLNEVLKTSMNKIEGEKGHVPVIVKYDKIPVVKGKREELSLLFGELLNMVFSSPPPNNKILLYIQCVEDTVDEDIMDLSDAKVSSFSILFHTNIETSKTWTEQNKAMLEACRHNASQIRGTLAHYNITKTGCLFSLKLSGKIF
ncbi:MAG TPA: hypothetical protein VM935_19355 [Chitinophagaceae bacterium]|nr:hypothetical protein [Chitinophagaceae bacterium]